MSTRNRPTHLVVPSVVMTCNTGFTLRKSVR